MQLQKFRVVFDSGESVEVQLKTRDLALAERDGFKFDEARPMQGSYTLALAGLRRLHRTGDLQFDLPEDADGLMDVADIELIEDPDTEGEGSGQGAATG